MHLFRGRLNRNLIRYRNIGANIPDLFERFLRGDDAGAIATLTRARDAGVRFVRCFGTTWGPENFGLFEADRARWFGAFDRMLAAADAASIAVVPSLLFNIRMLPDYVRQKTGKVEGVTDYLTPGSASNSLAVTYVTEVVSRYRNDPRVLLWEIGNEYNLEADLSAQWKQRPASDIPNSDQVQAFLIQIAKLIKGLDRRHLVTSGNSDMRPYAWHIRQAMLAHRKDANPTDYPMDWMKDSYDQYKQMLAFFNPPPLDIISVHQYPPGKDTPFWLMENDDYAFVLPWTRRASDILGKPLFVGEFAQKTYVDGKEQETPWLLDFLKRLVGSSASSFSGAAPLAAVWSWEFDPENPDQSPYSLSPERTPAAIRAIAQANAAIRIAILAEILPNVSPQALSNPPKDAGNPPPDEKQSPQ
jgi:hypothetical protein